MERVDSAISCQKPEAAGERRREGEEIEAIKSFILRAVVRLSNAAENAIVRAIAYIA